MKRLIFISAIVLVCFSCTKERKHNYVIGVSQCSEDYWRETVNREMVLEATFQDGLEVRIRSVKDDSEQQIRDIESFLKDKVDLLVGRYGIITNFVVSDGLRVAGQARCDERDDIEGSQPPQCHAFLF